MTKKNYIFAILIVQKVNVAWYDLNIYKCSNYGMEFRAKHTNSPQNGDMVIHQLTYIPMLKFNLSGPIMDVQELLEKNHRENGYC